MKPDPTHLAWTELLDGEYRPALEPGRVLGHGDVRRCACEESRRDGRDQWAIIMTLTIARLQLAQPDPTRPT